ncbi:MAG: carbohydrate ABC transporter permease, partial [Actinomycetota bacterium]
MRITRERRTLLLMLAPFGIGVAVLIVVPAVVTFVLSLFDYDLLTPAEFRGLGNFTELFGDDIFRISLRNSLHYILFAVPLRLLGAVGVALLLHRRFRGVGVYRTATYLPTVVPDVAYALLWLWILNPLYGPMNLALVALGFPPVDWLTSPGAARAGVIIMSLFTIGEGFVVALATRQEVPDELYELASLEGVGSWRVFGGVTLPMMAPTLALLMFRDTIFSFQANFVPALLVTGGGPPPYATT